MRRFFSALLVGVYVTACSPVAVQAAALSDVSLKMSRQSVSTGTNIELRFIANDPVSVAGDAILLRFDSGFSFSGLGPGDVSLSHRTVPGDEVVESLGAAAGAGRWGISVTEATRQIVFTPPTDVAADEIGVGEQVIIRIGQNVTGGSGQITTPSTVGEYGMSVGGGFDGFTAVRVPIVLLSASRFTVGFTVPASSQTSAAAVDSSGGGATSAAGSIPVGGLTAADAASTQASTSAGTTDATAGTPTVSPTSGDAASAATQSTTPNTAAWNASHSAGVATTPGSTGGPTGAVTVPAGSSTAGGNGTNSGSGGGSGATGFVPTSTVPVSTSTVPSAADVPVIPTAPTGSDTEIKPLVPIVPLGTNDNRAQTSYEWRRGDIVLSRSLETRPRVVLGDEFRLGIQNLSEEWSGWVETNGSRYSLMSGGQDRYATIRAADSLGVQTGTLTLFNGRDPERSIPFSYEVVSPFVIHLKDAKDETLTGSTAEILQQQRGGWKRVELVTLGDSGVLTRYMPSGTYRIEVRKKDWQIARSTISLASGGPLSGQLELVKDIPNPLAAIKPDAGIAANTAAVAQATVDVVQQLIEQARTPATTAAAEVAAPVAVAVGVGAATAAASSFNVLAYLRFLLTQPALLVRRRKREKWGLVYNAITKQPVDLAVVRLVDKQTGAVKQTRITDAQGRFAFLAQAGSYRFQVVKPGFVYPSTTLAKATVDIDLVDLYHGEDVSVQGSATLTPNIPIDPVEKTETPKAILRKKLLRRVQSGISIGSLLVAGVALVLQPTVGMGVFAAAQVGAFFLFRRLAVPPKPKNWGIVYDASTKKPLAKAVVRVFDKKYNKLLETQVTDQQGKYAFFAGKNVYYVTAEIPGYERLISKDLDLRQEAMSVIREPLALQPMRVKATNA